MAEPRLRKRPRPRGGRAALTDPDPQPGPAAAPTPTPSADSLLTDGSREWDQRSGCEEVLTDPSRSGAGLQGLSSAGVGEEDTLTEQPRGHSGQGCEHGTELRGELQPQGKSVHRAPPPPPACCHHMQQLRRTHAPFHRHRCHFICSNSKAFSQHLARASLPSYSFGCPACPFKTCGQADLRQHCREAHPPGGQHPNQSQSAAPPHTAPGEQGEGAGETGGQDVSTAAVERECESSAERQPGTKNKRSRQRHFRVDVQEGMEHLYKTHICPECKRCFKKRTHLVEHLHLHFPDPSLQCPHCTRFFTSKGKLKVHLLRELGEKAHHCPLCEYRAVERNSLSRHMASMHENTTNFYSDVYSCPVCEQHFTVSNLLKEHMKLHRERPKHLGCFQQSCPFSSEDRGELQRHTQAVHGVRAVECQYRACPALFGTVAEMETHLRTHYAFHCDQCDFVCSNKHAFRQHRRQGHSGSEELSCTFCPFITFNPVEFSDHVGKMHANEKIHKCSDCSFATAHKRVLNRHVLLHTGEKPHKCEVCDFTCRDVGYLSKHMLTHSDTKNYMCTECGYITKWKHYLTVHMRKHTGDLRYHCNQCSYRCHRADQLSSHKLRHQGKSLICEVCGFACKRKYELQKHMQVKHCQDYKVPVYQCRYCSYQTPYKQALLNHENCKHTQHRAFRCALCTYSTFSNTSLFFHKRKVHGYVPGDKVWLDNYARQELAMNSSDLLLGYSPAGRSARPAQPGTVYWPRSSLPVPMPGKRETEVEGDRVIGAALYGSMGGLDSAVPSQDMVFSAAQGQLDVSNREPPGAESHHEAAELPETPSGSSSLQEVFDSQLDLASPASDGMEGLVSAQLPALGTWEACEAEAGTIYTHFIPGPSSRDASQVPNLPENFEVGVGGRGEHGTEIPGETGHHIQVFITEDQSNFEFPAPNTGAQPGAHTVPGGETWLSVGTEGTGGQHSLSELQEDTDITGLAQLEVTEVMGLVQSEVTEVTGLAQLEITDLARSEVMRLAQSEVMGLVQSEVMGLVQSEVMKVTEVSRSEATEVTRLAQAEVTEVMGLEQEEVPEVMGLAQAEVAELAQSEVIELAQAEVTEVIRLAQVEVTELAQSEVMRLAQAEVTEVMELAQSEVAELAQARVTEGLELSQEEVTGLARVGVTEITELAGSEVPEVMQLAQECEIKALRKQDRQRAQALVLEGRVQMLVIQSDAQVFKCENCSYVTRKEKAMIFHSKSGCQGRRAALVCSGCGANFKQQRGLTTHQQKKCPLVIKSRKLYVRQATASQSSARLETELTTQPELPTHTPHHRGGKRGRRDQPCERATESTEQRPEAHSQRECEGLAGETSHCVPPAGTQAEQPAGGQESEREPQRGCQTGYSLEEGKFRCDGCGFVCDSEADIQSHGDARGRPAPHIQCRSCQLLFKSQRALRNHQAITHHEEQDTSEETSPDGSGSDGEGSEGEGSEAEGDVKRGRLSCPSCPFSCSQERALATHRKKGCLRVGELQCSLCSFVCKSPSALRHHAQLHRGKGGRRPELHCQLCPFTCKQSRCLQQHVAIKHQGLKPYKCRYCNFSTARRYRLDAHESLHTGHGRLSCDSCQQTFGTGSKLRIHKLRVHEKRPTHFCPLCDYSAYNQNDIRRHNTSCHSGELSLPCGHCEARFSSAGALKHHCLRQHQVPTRHGCPSCPFVCRSEATLKSHEQKQHPQLLCGTCKAGFSSREALESHRHVHYSHRCEHCPFATRDRQQLIQHLLDSHEGGPAADRPLRCPSCDFSCRHQLVYEQHVKGHGGTRLYKCTDCDYTTRNRQKITWHSRIHTGEKPYKCRVCSYACADPSRLKYHMRIHQDERKYLCPECGYKCKWINQLKYHMTKHTGAKPYQCDECEYCTNRADALRTHKETRHREARGYICEQCGKGFKTRFLLKTHLKKHSEEKPYVCGVCYRSFRWQTGLRHHHLTHTNQHPFYCHYCPYTAKQKFQVVKHIQRHHPVKAAEDPGQGVGKVQVTHPMALCLTPAQDTGLGEPGVMESLKEPELNTGTDS